MSLRLGETLIAGSVTQTIDLSTILFALFPVGAIYQGNMSECPLAALMPNTTWELVSQGKVLQGADEEHPLGSEIPDGLPDIYGAYFNPNLRSYNQTFTGAFTATSTGETGAASSNKGSTRIQFDASNYNSIYGANNKVQPAAYVVNIWERKS